MCIRDRRLGIPSIELTRLYQVSQIHKQYQALAKALDVTIDDEPWLEKARAVVHRMQENYSGTTVAIGEMQNGNAYEMALALTRYGFVVREIYANLGPDVYKRQGKDGADGQPGTPGTPGSITIIGEPGKDGADGTNTSANITVKDGKLSLIHI